MVLMLGEVYDASAAGHTVLGDLNARKSDVPGMHSSAGYGWQHYGGAASAIDVAGIR
jgi:hypothetical protein